MYIGRESFRLTKSFLRIDKGKKFNAKKETALGETYYGIKIFRFYIVSKNCHSIKPGGLKLI